MVVGAFGEGILKEGREIDRKKLGQIVFSDRAALDRLNNMMHPWMYEKVMRLLEECRAKGVPVVVVEIPLLVEVPLRMRVGQPTLSDEVDEVWVTVASEEAMLKRLEEKGIDREQALRRIRSQASSEERQGYGDVLIDTDRSLEEVEAEVRRVWKERLQ